MYQRALLAVEFDEVGHHAARHAAKLMNKLGGVLHLTHIIEPFPAYAYPGFAGFTEIEEPLKQHAETQLQTLGQELGVDEDHLFLEIGSTKHEVLRLAKDLNIDLIIAGSHSKHGIAYLLGSTSNAILHGAECDVLIVRPDTKAK
ncbi:MAG: universal stress protein [Legionellales bacterium]|nr:universal stress protein [Legionellales bacterium]